MKLDGKNKLIRLKAKNKGNKLLTDAIDDLIKTIESKQWKSKEEVKADRPDADQVHSDGFYFFDINIHRTMIMILVGEKAEAEVIWTGTHQEYESTFKNNKVVIKKWLSKKGLI
jgi:mRNA-degrading endonuclease HigB of HigAB toxin-antitoxin module